MSGANAPSKPGEMSEIRRLGKHTAIYATGTLLAKLASFLMLPIYTHFLTPSDYGVLELLSMTINVVGMLAGIGIGVSVFRFRAEYAEERDKAAVMSTAAIAMTVTALATAGLGIFFSPALSHVILKGAGRAIYFRVFFLTYLAQTLETIPLLQVRAEERSTFFVGVSTAKLVGMLTLNIYLVAIRGMGVMGVLVSSLVVTSTSALLLGIGMFRRTGMRFDLEKLGRMVGYGYPMVFVFVGNFILVFSDRYFLQQFSSTAQVGLYSLAYQFAFVLSAFAMTPFQQIWAPQRFVIATRPDAREIFARVFTYLNLALGAIALGLVLFAGDVLRIMSAPAFWRAAPIVPMLVAAQVLWSWCNFVNIGLLVEERTGSLAGASTVGVAATLLLNFLLIPRYGMWGAAGATFLAYGVRFSAIYMVGQRRYPIPFEWGRLGRLYSIVAAAAAVRLIAGQMPLAGSVGLSAALALVAAGTAYAFVLKRPERERLRELIRSRTLLAAAALRG